MRLIPNHLYLVPFEKNLTEIFMTDTGEKKNVFPLLFPLMTSKMISLLHLYLGHYTPGAWDSGRGKNKSLLFAAAAVYHARQKDVKHGAPVERTLRHVERACFDCGIRGEYDKNI